MEYEQSINVYRDIKNSMDTAEEKGVVKGKEEEEEKNNRAKEGLKKGYPIDIIADLTGGV